MSLWRWVVLGVSGLMQLSFGCSEDSKGSGGVGGGGHGGAAGSGAAGAAGSGGGTGGAAGSALTGGAAGSGASGGAASVWQPKPGTSWQWQLSGTVDTSLDVAMYDVDLFEAPSSAVSELRAKGRVVICYFSAGSREDWRPDAADFETADHGKGLVGWPGETWLDVRSANVRAIMKKRLDLAVSKQCDGVEPDNVDGYDNDTGFPLTAADQIDYLGFLSAESHARGLSVGLKNTLGLVPQVLSSFDWALNEECLSFSECADLSPFIQAGKAVFHVEYVDQESEGAAKQTEVCGDPTIQGFSTLIKKWQLDAWRLGC